MIRIFATFHHSHYIELAISKLEESNICDLYAVPLDKRTNDMKWIDPIHGTDGTSLVDIALVLAMMCGTVGVSRGFVLHWGPVFWGIIGAVGGFTIGFLIDLAKNLIKRKKMGTTKYAVAEIILIVQCEMDQIKFVERTLWENQALGLAKIH